MIAYVGYIETEGIEMTQTIEKARKVIAELATAEGEVIFAREVMAGCWDHRRDVQAVVAGTFTPRAINVAR